MLLGTSLDSAARSSISSGVEITTSYGPDAVRFPSKFDRQRRLMATYFFSCNCSTCKTDKEPSPQNLGLIEKADRLISEDKASVEIRKKALIEFAKVFHHPISIIARNFRPKGVL